MSGTQRQLISTRSGRTFPFGHLGEFAPGGESLELHIPDIKDARIGRSADIYRRFGAFLPFGGREGNFSLGEGNTPLVEAHEGLCGYCGLERLYLKNETLNPTWSFKDRGTLSCIAMSHAMGEKWSATVSTGNMGNSLAAYGARAGIGVLVFVPAFVPEEKLRATALHGARILRIAGDYSRVKRTVLGMAEELDLRIVSGNGPLRVEGYKLTAFELYEQMRGRVPDYIAVPTSACGHIRGIFKGFRELQEAGITDRLPKMIVVQAANNSPIVTAMKQGKDHIIPFRDIHTVAGALTTGDPPGGDEIIDKARRFGWPAEVAEEEEIIDAQRILASAGYYAEPATATSLPAVKKLRERGVIPADASVVIMLTGAGFKDTGTAKLPAPGTEDLTVKEVRDRVRGIMSERH